MDSKNKKGFLGWILLMLLLKLEISNSESRPRVGILFNPIIPDEIPPRDIIDWLIPQIRKVASRFTYLYTEIEDKDTEQHAQGLIPLAVATYNLNHIEVGHSPLEVSIVLPFQNFNNKSTPPSGWTIAKNAADDANLLFPGTVKRIDFDYDDWAVSENVEFDFETYLHNTICVLESNYKLGISMSLRICTNKTLSHIFRQFHYVSFEWSPALTDISRGLSPSLAVQKLSTEFIECQKLISRHGEGITFGINTYWLNRLAKNVHEHDTQLVAYWIGIRNWAVKANLYVKFWQAFDETWGTYSGTGIPNKAGWWRLIKNVSYIHSSEYVFEEKCDNCWVFKEGDPFKEESLQPGSFRLWVMAAVLSIVFVSLIVYFGRKLAPLYLPRAFFAQYLP